VSKALSPWFGLSLCTLGYLYATSNTALAQVTSDGTVNTQVNQNGNVAEITGGQTRGGNLFHSFRDFSVGTGDTASFLNANDIANIFSRVTGGKISNIDGLIKANGSANLFLINPAGILFGENARLDVGGSFLGSTANSVLFEDGEFSAVNNLNQPILTINAPIGLNLRDQPADIVNRSAVKDSTGKFVGLEVLPGNNLAFVGGNIKFEAGEVTAKGGNIELGGLSAAGTVSFNQDGSLSFPEGIAKADISLINASEVDVRGTGGGNITVNARNFNLEAGEFNGSVISSFLQAGITADSTSAEAQAGDITINATESVTLDNSSIFNNVEARAKGNSGDLNLTTTNLSLNNNSGISASTLGQGNAGLININAIESITLDNSAILNAVGEDAEGNGGELNLTTANLSLSNNSGISTSTYGQGNAGLIDINATESVTLDNSAILNAVGADAEGNGGELNLTTANLSLINNSGISAGTLGKGKAGFLNINAIKSVTLNNSRIFNVVGADAEGNGGELNLTTANLSLTNNSEISASTYGQGSAGNITIDSSGDVSLNTGDIFSNVREEAEGNAGEISISANSISLINGAQIQSGVFKGGRGNGGKVDINVLNTVTFAGRSPDEQALPSGIFTDVESGAEGNGSDIELSAKSISLTDGASLRADNAGIGNAGNITIKADENFSLANNSYVLSNIGSSNRNPGEGNGKVGNISIEAKEVSLTDGSQLQAGIWTGGQGEAGVISVKAQDSILFNGLNSGIYSNVESGAVGNGSDIELSANSISFTDVAGLRADNAGIGNAGNVNVNSTNLDINRGIINAATASNEGGNINLKIDDTLTMRNDSLISAQALNNANGGNINIDTNFIVAFPNQIEGNGSDIIASAAEGDGGNIRINAESLFGIQERKFEDNNRTNDIDASSEFGLDGTVSIFTPDINPVQGATELPSNIVEAEQTTQQACEANRETEAKNGLVINGKGGIPAPPDQPLTSQNLLINGEVTSASAIPEPIETSDGKKVHLARGIKFTKDGGVILTPYPTNNAGERIPEIKPNCI
jgi:filamentous hemagglutinin family protein